MGQGAGLAPQDVRKVIRDFIEDHVSKVLMVAEELVNEGMRNVQQPKEFSFLGSIEDNFVASDFVGVAGWGFFLRALNAHPEVLKVAVELIFIVGGFSSGSSDNSSHECKGFCSTQLCASDDRSYFSQKFLESCLVQFIKDDGFIANLCPKRVERPEFKTIGSKNGRWNNVRIIYRFGGSA